MTPRMQEFLQTAAECKPGKGIGLTSADKRIAARAVDAGYGMTLTSIFSVFIINDTGRAALAKATGKEGQ